MAISGLIAGGIGFNPGSVKFIPTRGLIAGEAEETTSPTGGWFTYSQEYFDRKNRDDKLRKKAKAKLKKIQDEIDKEIAERIQPEAAERDRLEELQRLTALAEKYQKVITAEQSEKVVKAAVSAVRQKNFSAMEALERELKRAKEEEEFLLKATMILLNQ